VDWDCEGGECNLRLGKCGSRLLFGSDVRVSQIGGWWPDELAKSPVL